MSKNYIADIFQKTNGDVLVDTIDSRLNDARTPTAHTHSKRNYRLQYGKTEQ